MNRPCGKGRRVGVGDDERVVQQEGVGPNEQCRPRVCVCVMRAICAAKHTHVMCLFPACPYHVPWLAFCGA